MNCPTTMPPKRTNKKLAKEHDLDESDVREVREAFDLVAGDSTTIRITAVQSAMSALGLDVTLEESKAITAHLTASLSDSDDNQVPFEMFLDVVAVKMSDRDKASEVDRAFDLFDPTGTGVITLHDLRRIAKTLGEEIKEDDLLSMLEEAGNGRGINKTQFEEVMSRAGMW